MIRTIEIEGFKSIDRLELPLGRVTVLIGENGCGKSNILEAIAFASAASADRLDHEFLASRGIRNLEPRFMRPAFSDAQDAQTRVDIRLADREGLGFIFQEDSSSSVPGWLATSVIHGDPSEAPGSESSTNRKHLFSALSDSEKNELVETFASSVAELFEPIVHRTVKLARLSEAASTEQRQEALLQSMTKVLVEGLVVRYLPEMRSFLVFSPENSALRVFQAEEQILPIGINGEGLFAHLRALKRAGKTEVIDELSHRLGLIDWFASFDIPDDLGSDERRLTICDRYLPHDISLDQRSANEGFLFLLFYYTLLLSPDTPKFFAIDNIDASLNPRLCARLMKDVVELAKQHDRQVVVTTHNPAVLDGLDLTDDEQRLVVVSRSPNGPTRVRRVRAPEPIEGEPPLRLSEAFIRGFLGGLPGNF